MLKRIKCGQRQYAIIHHHILTVSEEYIASHDKITNKVTKHLSAVHFSQSYYTVPHYTAQKLESYIISNRKKQKQSLPVSVRLLMADESRFATSVAKSVEESATHTNKAIVDS